MKLDTIVAIKPEPKKGGRRKGTILPERSDDQGRRRLDSKIYVRYFDIGLNADGTENALPTIFLDRSPVDPYTNTAGGAHTDLNPHAIKEPMDYTGHRDDYNAFLLTGDRDDWEEQYKEVFADENIQFFSSYVDTSTYFENRGYRLNPNMADTDPYRVSFSDGGWELLWHRFTTSGDPEMKITRTPDYDDDEAELTIDGNSSVFLVPALKHFDGRAGMQEFFFGSFWTIKYIYMFGHYVKQVPRAFIQGDSTVNPLFTEYWAANGYPSGIIGLGANMPVKTVVSDAAKAAWYEMVTSEPGASCNVFRYKDWVLAGSNPATIDTFIDAGGDFSDVLDPDFKYFAQFAGNNLPLGHIGDGYVTDVPHVRWFGWYRKAGQLVAVIHKKVGEDSGWYYIWNTQDSDTATLSPKYPKTDRIYGKLWNQFDWFAGLDQGVTLRQHNT